MNSDAEELDPLSYEALASKWLLVLDGLVRDGDGLPQDQLVEFCEDFPDLVAFVPRHREPDGALSPDDTIDLQQRVSDFLAKSQHEETIGQEEPEY